MNPSPTLLNSRSTSAALAPALVFTYTRVGHFVRTIEALKNNHLAPATTLYVVSDGSKNDADAPLVKAIRDYTDNLTGFREIVRLYREKNLGPDMSPRLAEEQVLSDHGRAIIMEDDNVSSPNYLSFINGGLSYFNDDQSVFSVCGYRPAIDRISLNDNADFFFYPWNISWGFGVWKHKTDNLNPLTNRYPDYRRNQVLERQNMAGGLYISDSLRRDFYKQKRFPDAILCTEMFRNNLRSVLPTQSKIHNIGLDGSGQSSKKVISKFDVDLDSGEKTEFCFASESERSTEYIREISKLYNGSSATRFLRKLGLYHHAAELSGKLASLIHLSK